MITPEAIEKAQTAVVNARLCLSGSLIFTRYFFKKRFNRKFVIGDHHRKISDVLDRVYSGEIARLIINIAPRYSKTEIAVKNFIANGLAINPAAKFIHLSYSDDLALDNSEETKNIVQSQEYKELFPDVVIKKNSDSKKKWYTTKGGGVYATSAAGQVTGFGAGLVDIEDEPDFIAGTENENIFGGALIIDDPIKPEDADNELLRDKVNKRFDSTIRNRVNSRKTPIIVIMQRLHQNDLCGHIMAQEPGQWTILSLSCINDDGTALWPFKHTLAELEALRTLNPINFERQYLQKPMPLEGRLYKTFKTYKELPYDATVRKNVTDTADTGSDYLCSIDYLPTTTGYYVTDVLYTQDGMEITEGKTAMQLTRNYIRYSRIESNGGGRGFARNVERICREMGNYNTSFEWYHQKDNKRS